MFLVAAFERLKAVSSGRQRLPHESPEGDSFPKNISTCSDPFEEELCYFVTRFISVRAEKLFHSSEYTPFIFSTKPY